MDRGELAPMNTRRIIGSALLLAGLFATGVAQTASERSIPARVIPTPTTVSPELQKVIAPAWQGSTNAPKLTNEQWKAMAKQADEAESKTLGSMKDQFHVTVNEQHIGG